MLLGTVTEVFSLGMVLPFLGALTAPNRIFEHPWAQPMVTGLGLTMPQQLLLPLTVLFGLAAVLAGATRFALLWGQTRLGNAIGVDLGSAAYRRTLYQSYAVHSTRNSSEVVAVLINKINTIVYFIIIPLLTLVTSIFIVLTIVVFMVLVDPELTAMTFLGFGCLYVMVAYTTKKRLARDSHRVTAEQNHVVQVVQEGLGGIRDVLIDGLQETYFRIYRQADSQLRRALANIAIIGGAPRPVIEAFGLVLIGWLAYALLSRPESRDSAIPILGVLALAAQRLLPLVQQGYAGLTSMLGGQASLRDVLVLLEQPLPAYSTQPPPVPMPFSQQITLADLHFRYSPKDPWVLRGIELQISRGSRVGFIGTTGSGKSTLLDIVMGLLAPSFGTLRIDGTAVDDTNHRAWQAHIAHVPQAIYLIDATIAENIAFGLRPEDIDWERVQEAAKRAQIADTIESWSKGYDTFVGERGIRLSGGQRQRIGIARALYKKADVLVFDEATSALDNETEHAVMEAIEALDPDLTILMVAHRLTTLKNSTQVVELIDGRIAMVGSYDALVSDSPG
ncbi:MAG: ABC transporter ATP-binding protein/permease [Proteobacteria bacterium]|nr:ABC transporter ATP-binding protein/permease [Pseudomonadota bacterium]